MLFGLGLPEWLTIIGLIGGLILTFYTMAKASAAYDRKRKAREAQPHQSGSTDLETKENEYEN